MERLEGIVRADAAIVGGGLAGLLLASALTERGLRVTIVDASDMADEIDHRSASALLAPVFGQVETFRGLPAARQYAEALQSWLHTLLDAPPPYVRPAPVYAYARTAEELPLLHRQQALYARLGLPVTAAQDAGGCPFPVELSLVTQGAAVDVARWKSALRTSILRQGGRIFPSSRVAAIDGNRIYTDHGCVEADHIVFLCGKPPGLRDKRLLALLESRVYAHTLLTGDYPLHSCQQDLPGRLTLTPSVFGLNAVFDGGRLGSRTSLAEFEPLLRRRLPDWQLGEVRYSQHIRSADGLPVIGALPGTRALFGAGYAGILGAMHAAEVLSRRIAGRPLPQDALYSPERTVPHRLLLQNTAVYMVNLPRRTSPRCAHCGCRLRWCTARRRWDCPYCGTAYTMLGQLAAGPGTRPARLSVRQRPDM